MKKKLKLTEYRITVLLVDDQPLIGDTLRRMLKNETDIRFYYCEDPTRAIDLANEIFPTVILQDLVMPKIDGLVLLRNFRTNPATRDVPLIVLSTTEEPHVKSEAFALGANDYMVKLPHRLEVIARIRYHSKAHIHRLERNEAYEALLESQKQLELRNRFIRKTFGRYLSDEIVENILETPEGLKLGGEKRLVTIMMADLRGFTTLCERIPAESVVGMLNIYLEEMTEIIVRHNGTIGEFIGDAIMVVFGAPDMRSDDACRAIKCSLAMQLAMPDVNAVFRKKGYPEVQMGIGAHTGEVVVGNIGSKKRVKYDFIGHHVNLASRIESHTLGGQILISETTFKACGLPLNIAGQMEVMPKGVAQTITLYDIIGVRGEDDLMLPGKSTETPFVELSVPSEVRLTVVLEGKQLAKTNYSGVITKLADKLAEIRSDRLFRLLTDIKLSLFDKAGDQIHTNLYAKVVETVSQSPPVFRVAFTYMPPEAETFVDNLLVAIERQDLPPD
jgi:adenylate cyclase